MSGLTPFQSEVARLFFSLPASEGSCSPAAARCSPLVSRPDQQRTWTSSARGRADVAAARDQFETALAERGWRSVRLQDSETFLRLHLSGDGEVIVDIAIDAAAEHPPVVTIVGPTFDPEELAGRKLAALFGRAEARDFADVYVLAQRFGKSVLLERAAEVDLGFDHRVLAQMMRTLDRFTDDEIPVAGRDVDALRAYFRQWAELG